MILTAAIAFSLPALAQDHGARGDNGKGGSRGSGDINSGNSSISSQHSWGGSTMIPMGSRDFSHGSGSYGSYPGTIGPKAITVPNPQYSSFTTWNTYWNWQYFFYRLQTQYYLDPGFAHRFVVNREPLLTPSLLHMAVMTPLRLSSLMLAEMNDLDLMLQNFQNGKNVDRAQITLKIREIRKIAKQISGGSDWDLIDQRKNKDILKGLQFGDSALNDSIRLRKIATDLHAQLQNWYTSSNTNTISASTLAQPSIESLTRGIEKISKAMENSVRRM